MTSHNRGPSRAFALVPAVILVVAVLNLNLAYASLGPGPTADVAAITTIDGAPTYSASGRLLLTTVEVRSGISLAEVLWGWMNPATTVVPESHLRPPGISDDEVREVHLRQMMESQLYAAAAALTYLGHEVRFSSNGALVARVLPDAPSAGLLRPGDQIVGADNHPVRDSEELVARIVERNVGDEVRLTLLRRGEEVEVTVRTTARPEDPERPVIGVEVQTIPDVELPFDIRVDAGRIGGPSAGMMFALNIVELLEEEDLTRGRTIAGTGVITLEGVVRPVGGVAQKVTASRRAGADVFLVPYPELALACSVAGDLEVFAIRELGEAVEFLRGAEVPGDRTCG